MRWLDRCLLHGPKMAFVTNEKQFRAAKKACGLECAGPWLLPHQHACVHTYGDADDQPVCIVAVSLAACAKMDSIDVAALLTHEAVHVWQRVADQIGGDLGREMEAYAVQNIARGLMLAYVSAVSACSGVASKQSRQRF